MSEVPIVEEAAVESSFKDACRSFAESFLQTVVVLDDEAYIKEPESEPVDLETPNPRGETLGEASEGAAATTTLDSRAGRTDYDPNEQVAEKPPQRRPSTEHELDAKQLVASFAERGLVCAVLTPDEVDDLAASFVNAARRSDITIIDWLIKKDDGELAQKTVKAILELDQSCGGRLRLIAIYTGEPDLGKIRDVVGEFLTGFELTKIGDTVLQSKHSRIVVLPKADGNNTSKPGITETDLPDAVIDQFLELTFGLLPNAALGSISAIRNDTHRILARFRSDLDGAYLSHRILHKTPEDAEGFLVDLLCDEFHAVLESHDIIEQVGTRTLLDAYVNSYDSDREKNDLALTKDAGKDPIKTVTLEEVRESIVSGIDGVPESWGKKKSLFNRIYPLFHQDAAEGKGFHHKFGRLSSLSREAYGDLDLRESWLPTLRLGTILCELGEMPEYFACIQPACDCLRNSGVTPFIFAPLKVVNTEKGFDFVVVGTDDILVKLKSETKPNQIRIFYFNGDAASSSITAIRNAPHYVFSTSETDTVEQKELYWIGDLRKDISARLAHLVASNLSRIGPDEYEWQRLSK